MGFRIGDDSTLHCPDFSRDVSLDKELSKKPHNDESEESL
jgi:hypothetical protein